MARARNGVNQRGTYGRKPVGPIGKRPTPRVSDTGFGLRRPKKRRPRVSDTGFGLRRPKKPVSGGKKQGSMMDRLVRRRRGSTSPTKRKAIPVRKQGSPLMGLGRMVRGQRRR